MPRSVLTQISSLAVAGALLAACGGQFSPNAPSSGAMTGDRMKPDKAAAQVLYVSDASANTVYEFSLPSNSPIGEITDGISSPEGLATDSHGNLYVSNLTADTVTVYAPGATSPSLTLSEPDGPDGVAVTKNGDVVAGDNDGGVDVYAPGKTSPSRRLKNSGINTVFGVGVDAHDNAYAVGLLISGSNGTPAAIEFENLKGKGTNLGLEDLTRPQGVLLDANSNIVISDDGEVLVYAPGLKTPSTAFGAPQCGPSALNKSENLIYVSQGGNTDQVGVYDYPSGTFVTQLAFGSDYIGGTAVSPAAKP
ncbi:MAG TPA: hypothetical protein VFF63_00775 [Candidatus Babeliales bacterium]|nr:hypothetical protein [Candidatus Babeliales bacterium]